MVDFHDLSIRKKLTLIFMGTSGFVVLVTGFVYYGLITHIYQQNYKRDLVSLAKMIGFNTQVALSFNVPEDAEKVLASLGQRSSILSATIYDPKQVSFASYVKQNQAAVPEMLFDSENGKWIAPPGTMMTHYEIIIDGRKAGMICLVDDMESLRKFRRVALLSLPPIMGFVMLLAFFLAARFREIISLPITELATLAQKVSSLEDYSLRAVRYGNDEVGNLVDTFNKMLERIATRNKELKNSEHRFRTVIDQAVDSIFLHDGQGRLLDVNLHACDNLGYSRGELLTMTVEDIDAQAMNQEYTQHIWKKVHPGKPCTINGIHKRKDGSTFPVEVRIGILEFHDERVYMALVRDISERIKADEDKKKLEAQLQQAQKMESIGTLAGGIAHDFNNILTPIFGYISLTLIRDPQDKIIKEYLGEILTAAERARDLVKQILTFSRQKSEEQAPINVHIIIKEALKLLRASIPATIEIRRHIDTNCGQVLANPTQIHQIIMNLCTNAYYSMRESGGVLAVTLTSVVIHPNDRIKNIHLVPGRYLRLEVSDTGCGINPDVVSRIFEPYFTTKRLGEGTGLGLSVVHGIVKSHGGDITVYSESARGTTFHVYLPEIEKITSTESLVDGEPLPRGTESVLIVDDEQAIVRMEEKILHLLGYSVTTCCDPEEALRIFTEDSERFDLLITDMTMPHMTGAELAEQILKIQIDLPIILCTGYSEIIDREKAIGIGIHDYMMKPVIIYDLARVVRQALERKTPKNLA